ncbi:MAG: membrane protein insertase YidC [Gammaproteobacteria bacterium]|jgi:YidC/Oxa1 family membrane protein insertase|nr:membrane protein insertase YidC [Gammaproteobacteria bacterium]
MDNVRIILWGLFATLLFLTWQQWSLDYAPVVMPATESPVADPGIAPPASSPIGDSSADPNLPSITAPTATAAAEPAPAANNIVVETDVLRVEISRQGGGLVLAELLEYPRSKDAPDVPVQLLTQDPADFYVVESGLVDAAQGGPTHIAPLSSPADRYTLAAGQSEITVPLSWSADGVSVTKTYVFRRGSYEIDLDYAVSNQSASPWRGLSYLQIRRVYSPPERSMFDVDSYSFVGPVFYDGNSYDKLDPDDLADDPLDEKLAGGWIASIQHHFLAAAVPPPDTTYRYNATYNKGIFNVRASGATLTIPPGASERIQSRLFVGPKLQEQLEATAPELALTVDYGKLTLLAQPLFWLLQQVYNLVGNWGWTIILVTFMIKAAFYKLTETSGRSMAKMRKLQPRLKALQDRYKDDRQQLSQKMMELYKTEKVNPAAGCLPMLIQIPFFIAFYWVLLESVEMRQAPFALWITDLSSRDPFFVLPLLMGVAMFVQQKLNPAPPDPIQAKVMSILPVMFTGFFAFFPAGLVLYWLTNSVLSVLQQWNINRKMAVD